MIFGKDFVVETVKSFCNFEGKLLCKSVGEGALEELTLLLLAVVGPFVVVVNFSLSVPTSPLFNFAIIDFTFEAFPFASLPLGESLFSAFCFKLFLLLLFEDDAERKEGVVGDDEPVVDDSGDDGVDGDDEVLVTKGGLVLIWSRTSPNS